MITICAAVLMSIKVPFESVHFVSLNPSGPSPVTQLYLEEPAMIIVMGYVWCNICGVTREALMLLV